MVSDDVEGHVSRGIPARVRVRDGELAEDVGVWAGHPLLGDGEAVEGCDGDFAVRGGRWEALCCEDKDLVGFREEEGQREQEEESVHYLARVMGGSVVVLESWMKLCSDMDSEVEKPSCALDSSASGIVYGKAYVG